MTGIERDTVEQLIDFTESIRIKSEKEEKRRMQQVVEETSAKEHALEDSFSTFKPIIEPMLQQIVANYSKLADNYPTFANLTKEQVQSLTFEPRGSDFDLYPGHFALIWGSPKPHLNADHEIAVDFFTRANEKLISGEKLSERKQAHYEELCRKYGGYEIRITGINTLVVVAGVEKRGDPKSKIPIVRLTGNVIRSPEERDAMYYDYDIRKGVMIPVLSQAFESATGVAFRTNVRTFVTVGHKNLFPKGPFV